MKFLEQVYSKIKKRENLNIELRDTCIEIDDGKSVVFKIDSKGGMFYSADIDAEKLSINFMMKYNQLFAVSMNT